MLLAPWSRNRLKKNKEPEPLGKKSGAGAAKKLAGSSALQMIIKLLLSTIWQLSILHVITKFLGLEYAALQLQNTIRLIILQKNKKSFNKIIPCLLLFYVILYDL